AKGEDVAKVQQIMLDTMAANDMVVKDPEPFARLSGGTNEAMEFTVRAWCKSADYWTVYFDLTQAITEALGALSQIYVKEAFYEKLLKGQSVFDLESREMIDIILRTKVYDLIPLYSGADYNQMGSFLQNLDDAFKIDNSNLTSGYKSNARLCNFNAKQLVRAVNKIEG
ncbi:MAG: mechanosensitive ion channel, partial [Clostridia bacterium]|nr:mechanosensitive ion channel [Clostridia bacterium]